MGFQQIPIDSSDLAAAVLHLPNRKVLVISIYVPCITQVGLHQRLLKIRQGIEDAKRELQCNDLDTLLLGDFNRHDHLWGGESVAATRQGEADPILDLISDYNLQSLLPTGTPTFQQGPHQSTIDLALASPDIAETLVTCRIYEVEHGSDHRAITSQFDIEIPQIEQPPRYQWKSAPWGRIRDHIASQLEPPQGSIQDQTNHLMEVVETAVLTLTPRAKPSPYARRWWTSSLTDRRKTYTYWRNKARSFRRVQNFQPAIEQQAKQAAKEYHDAIRVRRKQHWDDFLAEPTNIWKASKYLRPAGDGSFDKVPPLQKPDGTKAIHQSDQSEILL